MVIRLLIPCLISCKCCRPIVCRAIERIGTHITMLREQIQAVIDSEAKDKCQSIKCVIWDLDNTIWDGVLLEDEQVVLRSGIREILQTLDRRGILLSIASKNNHELAMKKLTEFGLHEYFLYPQINWNAKASSVQAIAKSINIGLETLAFVDDQLFELEEVHFSVPAVLCINAEQSAQMLDMPEMMPRFITDDAQKRRQMYQSDIFRNQSEQEFIGTNEEFLATLQMVFSIAPAQEEDLRRAEELTVRTHQL